MKAILVEDPGPAARLVLSEVPEPEPRDGEVLVRVRATAVNRADLLQAAGNYPPPADESEILGLEIAGDVEGTGERVLALLPGGGYAERVAVPRPMLMPIPDGMSYAEAAAIPEAFLTAYLNLFGEANLVRGERALIHAAASGVGTAAVQLVRRAEATAIATVRSAAKAALLRSLGADLVVEAGPAGFAADVEARYGTDAIDVILDPVGAPYFAENLRLLRLKGRLVSIATMGGPKCELDLRRLLSRRLRLIGSTLRGRPRAEKAAITAAFVRDALPGFRDGTLRPVIDTVLPLDRAGEAHVRMAGNANAGKIVLVVGAPP